MREITGEQYETLASLDDEIPLLPPEPEDIDAWVKNALEQNFTLLAARSALEASRQEMERRRSGHFPVLDLVASHSYNDVGGGSFGSMETTDNAVGLRLNMPLYQGGAVQSQVREALQLVEQSKQNLERQKRATERQTRDAYQNIAASISRLKALRQALKSTLAALKAVEVGLEVGTRTTVDLLASRSALLRTRSDYSRARHDYVLATLRLKQAAGILTIADIRQIDSWLEGGLESSTAVEAVDL